MTTTTTTSLQLGFTQSLCDEIDVSRDRFFNWIQHEKARSDALTKQRMHEVQNHQRRIDRKQKDLLELQKQLDNGSSSNNEDDSSSVDEETKLLVEIESVQREMEELETKKAEQAARIQGTEEKLVSPSLSNSHYLTFSLFQSVC